MPGNKSYNTTHYHAKSMSLSNLDIQVFCSFQENFSWVSLSDELLNVEDRRLWWLMTNSFSENEFIFKKDFGLFQHRAQGNSISRMSSSQIGFSLSENSI